VEIIRGIEAFKRRYPNPVLTIGNFDSVHLGHQKIFQKVIARARDLSGTSMVMTFEPHPMKVLAPERDLKLLVTPDEKIRLIENAGIEALLLVRFDRDFAKLNPEEFIRNILVDRIHVREVIVGGRYVFGKNKKGTVEMLRRRGRKYGFTVRAVRNVKMHGHIVSSSTIRTLLVKGAVEEVAVFLGRPYSIKGTVIKGKGRGKRLLNIPTANITTPVEIVPREGVYAVRVARKGKVYYGVANIGKNPTFGNDEVSYEVHLLDFSGNLLGRNLRMYFIKRIRGEKTFPDIQSLERQIRQDMRDARESLSGTLLPGDICAFHKEASSPIAKFG
jgi:riboflavin kinase/FMN adenylyltransferase